MKEGLRAVGYGRVSTEEQEKSGTSIRDQFAGNHKKAQEIGARIVAYYEDSDSGGFYLTRKGLQEALRTLEEGKANILIVKDLVRLTRNDRAEQALILKRIKDAGAKVIFWDVMYEDSPMGEFALNVTGDFAILEKAVFKDRAMRGRRRRAIEGQMPCRTHAPFGYIVPKKDDITRGTYSADQLGKYILDPERHTIAAEIFHRIAAGESLHGICRWLQSSGVKTVKSGACWRISNIQAIVNNPAYYGLAAFGRQRTITDESRALNGYKCRTYEIAVPEEEWIRIPCPAIVSRDVWDNCQMRIRDSRERLSTRITRRQLLTGMLRCPKCRRVMTGRAHARSMPSHYKCKESSPSTNSLGQACWNKHINIKMVDPLVINAVKTILQNPTVIEQAYRAYEASRKGAYSEVEYQALKRELSDLRREEMNTAKAQIQGVSAGANTAVYESLLRELALKQTELQSRLDLVDTNREEIIDVPDKAVIIEKAMADVELVLDATEAIIPTPEKNAVLQKIIDHIYPTEDGSRFTITFSCFDNNTQLVAVVAKNEVPNVRVINTA